MDATLQAELKIRRRLEDMCAAMQPARQEAHAQQPFFAPSASRMLRQLAGMRLIVCTDFACTLSRFNKRQDEFSSKREYDDYLEMRETYSASHESTCSFALCTNAIAVRRSCLSIRCIDPYSLAVAVAQARARDGLFDCARRDVVHPKSRNVSRPALACPSLESMGGAHTCALSARPVKIWL